MNEEIVYRRVFENMEVPIFVVHVDAAGDIVFGGLNPACEKATGLREEAVVGKPPEDIPELSRESAAALRENCRRCLVAGDVILCEDPLPGEDRGASWRTQLAPVRDESGKIVQIVGSSTNITESRRAEEALRNSEERFHAIVKNCTPIVFLTDREGKILLTEGKMLAGIGLQAGDLVGKSVFDIWHDHPAITGGFRTALDGELFEGIIELDERLFEVFYSPYMDSDGDTIGVIGMALDVTERTRSEEKMLRSDQRLRLHREMSPLGFLEWDENFHAVAWNAASERIFGYTREEAIGRHAKDLILPEEVHELVEGIYQSLMKQTGGQHSINKNVTKDGRIITCEWFNTTLIDKTGKAIGVASICSDITERQRIDSIMQARLRLLELTDRRSMDEFLTATLDELELLTGSTVGFYHFLDADQKTLQLQSWSTNTLESMCTASGEGSHYDVAEAGVWVDCIHERRAVIHNDYSSLSHRKGMPEGHAPIERELVVPIFRGDLIKAVVGVGNKPINYDQSDVETLSQLGDLSWDIVERKQAADALREKQDQLIEAQHIGHIGNWWHDLVTGELYWSDEFFRIIGREKQKPTAELAFSILHPDDWDLIKHAMEESAAGKGEHEHEFRIVRPDGGIRWIHNRWAGIYDESGKEIKRIGTHQDITERKQAEEALRRSEADKTILNRIANIFLTVPDEAMYGEVLAIVLRVMKSEFGIFGYIEENGDLVIPSLTRGVWDECQVPGKSIIFPPESWGTSLWGRAIRERTAFHSDGPFHAPEGHIHIDHFLAVPVVSGEETIGLLSVGNKEGGYSEEDKDLLERIAREVSPILHARLQRDIQERRRMEAEKDLRESEEKYRLLITNAGEAIFVIQNEVVRFPNPKALKMTGYTSEELVGMPFLDLVHPEDKGGVDKRYLQSPEGGRRHKAYPFRIVDKSGREKWIQLTTAPITWEEKPGMLCFLRDVTEEKRLQAQLVQAQKMEAVGRLAGGVAHDFNNMLVVILGRTELALTNLAPSDPLHAQLQEIDKAARRSTELTRQLLAFARKQTVAPKVLDLNETVSGMLDMLRRLIGEEIDLAWMPGTEIWPVKIDPGQVDQMLVNLCVNARDAIAGVGKLTIETGTRVFDKTYCANHAGFIPGEFVLLAVSDDGRGMDAETQAHLFEPFYTTKGMGKGTGLGLATVYGIVKQNDGFINVYSEPGEGTTFKIYLPRQVGEPIGPQAASASKTPKGGKETILVVEDETAVLEFSERVLDGMGYTVLTARTPGEAIRLVEEHAGEIHLLIADVVMPEMNGRELADRLTSIKPDLKCLYMSGYTANVIAHRGALEEGIHFIQKPFSIKDFGASVREALDQ